MRIASVADPHIWNHARYPGDRKLGLNRRAREHLAALEWSVTKADEEGCDVFLVLGDLFDGANPDPRMVAAVQEILSKVNAIVLLGNHEMFSEAPGDNALAPLNPVAVIVEQPKLLTLEIDGREAPTTLALVPFMPGAAEEWLPETLQTLKPPRGSVLCLHLGISDGDTPGYLQGAHDSVTVDLVSQLMAKHGMVATFAGNWHERQIWAVEAGPIVQVGTLCPTGWDNPGWDRYGYMAIWDSETGAGQSISVPGPRFVKVRSETEFQAVLNGPTRPEDHLYVEWVASDIELEAAKERVRTTPNVTGGAVPDKASRQVAATRSAEAALSADTLQESLMGWIEGMDISEDIQSAVLRRCRVFLTG